MVSAVFNDVKTRIRMLELSNLEENLEIILIHLMLVVENNLYQRGMILSYLVKITV